MAYGREKAFKLGGPRKGDPKFKLQSDMKLHEHLGGKTPKKAAKYGTKKV